jgi:tape measure domain-containing protein
MATYVEELISRLSLDVNDSSFSQGERSISGIATSLSKIGAAAAAAGAAVLATAGFCVNASSTREDAEAAFTPLLGGADRAKLAVEELNKAAAQTPFEFETLSGAMKQLLPVMDGDIENTIKTINFLGDTAGGNAQKLDTITRGYTKAMLKGKVDMESLNMISEAGVPIIKELAKARGVDTAALLDMVSKGEIGTDDLTGAFQIMTSEGGIFFNGMVIASQTFSGRMSTLRDNISLTAAAIGKELMPYAKELVDRLIEITGAVQDWVKENGKLIAGGFIKFLQAVKVLFYAAAVAAGAWLLVQVGLAAMAIPAMVTALIAMVSKMTMYNVIAWLAVAANWAFNASMLMIPLLIGAAVVAVALLAEDLYQFFTGGKSMTGEFIDKLKEIIPGMDSIAAYWGGVWDRMWQPVQTLLDKVRSGLEKIPGYSASVDVVSRAMDTVGGGVGAGAPAAAAGATVTDNRVITVNGGDLEQVKKVVNGQTAYAAKVLDTGVDY